MLFTAANVFWVCKCTVMVQFSPCDMGMGVVDTYLLPVCSEYHSFLGFNFIITTSHRNHLELNSLYIYASDFYSHLDVSSDNLFINRMIFGSVTVMFNQ